MDGDSSPYIGLIIFFVLLIVNAVMYAFSSAIQSISIKAIEEHEEEEEYDKKKLNKLIQIIDAPDKFVLTIHVITLSMSMFAGVYIVFNLSKNLLWLCAGAFVSLWFIITFGVLVPKRLGNKYKEKCAFKLYNIVYAVMVLLTPVTFIIRLVTGIVLRMFGVDPNQIEDSVTEEDIVSMVNEGHEQGVLLASEAEMITNIFEYSDKEVKDIMTHRTAIVALDGDVELGSAVGYMLNENYSRFPVYYGDIDNIVGIVHFKDAVMAHEQKGYDNVKVKDIKTIVRKAEFIPETRNINDVFKEMQKQKTHMQIVIDEYGQTSGIVTMEDILEEIVGNIQDEYDYEEENIVRDRDNEYIINGMTTLEEIKDSLGIEIDDDDFDTVNGYLISKLDRIPSDNERPEIVDGKYIFKVLEIKNKMISKVQLKITADEIYDVISEGKGE